MANEAAKARVSSLTDDTKVVERGKGDGVFMIIAGIGVIPPGGYGAYAVGRCGAGEWSAGRIDAARDLTRGGLASALNKMAAEAGLCIEIDEALLPLRQRDRRREPASSA